MTPRTRFLIVGAIGLLFLGACAAGLYCGVSYFQGKTLNARAYREMVSGHFDAAIALYDRASRKLLDSTTLALVYGNRGWCCTKKERDDQAIQDFTESIRLDPRPLYSVLDRGLAYVRKGEFEKARADLSVALQKDPNLTEAYFNRGWISMFTGEWQQAIADFGEAARCDPLQPQYLVDRGMAFAANRQLDPALASFDSALRLNPRHAGAYIQRAAAYARKGNRAKGLADVTAAIEQMPATPQLYYARAYILLDRGLVEEAFPDCHETVRLAPNSDLAYTARAWAYAQDRNWPEVLRDSETALGLNPKNGYAHYVRGRAFSAQGKYDEAIAELTDAIRLEPGSIWAHYFRAENLSYRQEYSQALVELRKTVERFPKSEVSHLGLAWFLATCPHDAYRNGNEAVSEAIKGCELADWANWYGADVLGVAYAEQGDFEQAIKFADLALSLPGASPKDRALIEQRRLRYEYRIAIRDLGGAELHRSLIEEGISAYARNDYDRALKVFNVVLPPNPGGSVSAAFFHFFDGTHDKKNSPPWAPEETAEMTNGFYYRGLAYEKKREWDNAIADFSTVIWREPRSSPARGERGVCYRRKGESDQAFRDFDEMLRLNPDDALAYALRADALQMMGQTEGAAEACTTAIRLDPKLALAHDVRGRIFAARKEYEKADREFGEAERVDRKHLDNILASGYAFERRHEYRSAETEFRETAARFPRSGQAQNALAWFLATCPEAARRNGTEAVSYATLACDLTKWNDGGYLDTLAAAYAEIGDFEQAMKYGKEAIAKIKSSEDRKELEEHLVAFQRKEPWRIKR